MSSEHFLVDDTVIGVWASHKSFRPEGEDGTSPTPPAGDGRNAEAD
jgi:hypothetical protein